MFYQLPPVGNPIQLAGRGATLDPASADYPTAFSPWRLDYYASGTAALAAAMIAARRKKYGDTPSHQAEVILPAYGCPDLVAAAVYAGLKPVLVDLQTERPWLALAAVSAAMSDHTVAIVAVDLFGINERLADLRVLATKAGVVLIEDSAQGFPAKSQTTGSQSTGTQSNGNKQGKPYWQGELVVLSFGRGKPVSLLGGGAVLSPRGDNALQALLPAAENGPAASPLAYRVKAHLYNAMIHPRLYWLPDSLPFLHLGETRYHALESIDAMDTLRKQLLAANLSAYYRNDEHVSQLAASLREALAGFDDIIDLPAVCEMPLSQRLLRYPLLLPASRRDAVYAALKRAGLGPSIMYPAALPAIPGLDALLGKTPAFPQAQGFAARLLTLPLHGRVSSRHVQRIKKCLQHG